MWGEVWSNQGRGWGGGLVSDLYMGYDILFGVFIHQGSRQKLFLIVYMLIHFSPSWNNKRPTFNVHMVGQLGRSSNESWY